jgi:hypothetical protein
MIVVIDTTLGRENPLKFVSIGSKNRYVRSENCRFRYSVGLNTRSDTLTQPMVCHIIEKTYFKFNFY